MTVRARLRLAALMIGVGLLAWLSIEDQTSWVPVGLAAVTCAWIAARFSAVLAPQSRRYLAWQALVGLLAGALVGPVAVFLMVFKTGWHSHFTPDFTFAQVVAVLQRSPVWAAGGLLAGLGIALLRLRRDLE